MDTMTQGPSVLAIRSYLLGAFLILFGFSMMIVLSLTESLNLIGLTFGMLFVFMGVLIIYIGKQSRPEVPAPHRIPPPCSECGRILSWHKDPAGYYCYGCREYKD